MKLIGFSLLHRNDPKLFNKSVPWLPHTKEESASAEHWTKLGGDLDQWLTPNFLSFTNTNVCRNACCKSITKYKELNNKRLNFNVLSFLQEKAFYCHLCNTLSLNLASPWRACCLLVRAQFQSSKRREKQFLVLNALTKYFTICLLFLTSLHNFEQAYQTKTHTVRVRAVQKKGQGTKTRYAGEVAIQWEFNAYRIRNWVNFPKLSQRLY
jgi:hypothetical protein